MATAQTLAVVDIPGLHHSPNAEDFADSRNVSNGLPQPEEQPEISDTTLKNLGELFVRHDAHDAFGIHLLHAHFQVPEGNVLYGIQVQVSGNSESCWTKPVPAKELATKPIHGHVFHLQPNGAFVPYEFQEGEAPSKAAKVPKAFFQELAEFLHLNSLAGLVALQLLDGPRDRTKTELLVGPQGTLMMDTKDVLGFEPAQITTGWFFQVGEDGVISCKGNDVYAAKKNTHGVFQDSKPLPTLEALKAALLQEGIIA
ncbi:hypothetical protein FOCG_17632 [Fusarium oxysporum f. sp. radicis-lycopersici 26381]|nr:hypothetical protein FOCG_17632 [Fusarium oxysporum f. sp. radicis-lycopersici 26381]EXL39781.1 hypothetical protein FOCG_17632 [Fusarium oxysporum f. sp. radicis-lycopersici 26381]